MGSVQNESQRSSSHAKNEGIFLRNLVTECVHNLGTWFVPLTVIESLIPRYGRISAWRAQQQQQNCSDSDAIEVAPSVLTQGLFVDHRRMKNVKVAVHFFTLLCLVATCYVTASRVATTIAASLPRTTSFRTYDQNKHTTPLSEPYPVPSAGFPSTSVRIPPQASARHAHNLQKPTTKLQAGNDLPTHNNGPYETVVDAVKRISNNELENTLIPGTTVMEPHRMMRHPRDTDINRTNSSWCDDGITTAWSSKPLRCRQSDQLWVLCIGSILHPDLLDAQRRTLGTQLRLSTFDERNIDMILYVIYHFP